MAVVGIPDGLIERLVVDVVQARVVVSEPSSRRTAIRDKPPKEVLRRVSVCDSREGAVLAAQADAGMEHNGHEESGLTRREPVVSDRLDALIPRHHSRNSSAISG